MKPQTIIREVQPLSRKELRYIRARAILRLSARQREAATLLAAAIEIASLP